MPEEIWYNAGMKPFKYGCVVTGETFCPRPDLQKVLVALAKLGGRNVYSSEFMSAAEVPSSGTATKALQRLVADGLVFVHDKEYRFYNPFLRAWLINKGY